jgi:hypothetical protein
LVKRQRIGNLSKTTIRMKSHSGEKRK